MSQTYENQTPEHPQNDNPFAKQTDIERGRESADERKANIGNPSPPKNLGSFFNLELFFDFLLIAVTGIYAVFAYNQWRAIERQAVLMNQQLAAYKDSSAQTERLIKANEELAKLNASLVRNSGEQVKASIAQAEAATQQAKIAQQSFFIGDRPYLSANAVLDKFEIGTTPTIGIAVENNGKTPALDIEAGATVSVGDRPKPDLARFRRMSMAELVAENVKELPYGSFMPEGSKVFLAANGKSLFEIRGPQLTASLIADIRELRRFMFVWGAALYKDGLGKRHILKFCFFYNAADDMFVACPTFNSTK